MMRRAGMIAGIALLISALGFGIYLYTYGTAPSRFPPTSDTCVDMLISSLEAARSNPLVIVPEFSLESVASVRCGTAPGFTTFEITGTDSSGIPFHIIETTGGKAASGADTVFDYCYRKKEAIASQIRITGREGRQSDSTCRYEGFALPEGSHFFKYGF